MSKEPLRVIGKFTRLFGTLFIFKLKYIDSQMVKSVTVENKRDSGKLCGPR